MKIDLLGGNGGMEIKMKKLIQLFLTFLKIGAFTFGGGYAMIALLENEFIEKKKWIDREEFLNKELGRLTNIKAALEQQLKEAQAEIEVWKSEYQKEHDLRIKEVGSKGAPQEPVTAPAPTEEAQAELTEEEKLRAELELMTKAQILEFAKEAEIDMTPIANGKKPEMINFIMEQSKGE